MAGDRRGPRPPVAAGDASAGAGAGNGESVILDQPFDRDTLYQLRAAVSAHGAQAGLAPGRVGDLVLAVHELAANAVRHGAGHGRLLIWRNHQTLHCRVTDDGAAAVTGQAEVPADGPSGSTAQWGTEPGHGLWLVRQIADQATWCSAADGTTATVSFTLASQPSSSGAF
jgi:anti-sigma regulatory factor (Ser/Thr protein kinase)